jgi:RES domain-containing protein
MLLWRLSALRYAGSFDGGYGMLFDGRWNTVGHKVTYCATSPSLCVLEKLVHIEDPSLLPELEMVAYSVPDGIEVETIRLSDLPGDWRQQEAWTQRRGDEWHRSRSAVLLLVPSAIVAFPEAPDINAIVNHDHPAAASITIRAQAPFTLDPRLF